MTEAKGSADWESKDAHFPLPLPTLGPISFAQRLNTFYDSLGEPHRR